MKTSTTQNKSFFKRAIVRKFLVAFFWLAVWELVCIIVRQEILIVSPVRVFQRLLELGMTADFWLTTFHSMLRILYGFLIAVGAGTLLAVLTHVSGIAYDLAHPILSIVKATPVASFIILALVWIKTPGVPVFTAFLMVVPVVWQNVTNGILKTDKKLLQMADSYQFGKWKTVVKVYIPSVMPFFMAACTTGMGLAWKAGIAAEVLAASRFSIGGQIYNAKIYIETADLFAWTAVVILMSVILEKLMVLIMRSVSRRYRVSF